MESVLIVGGSGFIGRHTARRLIGAGYEVWATHTPQTSPPKIPNVRWLPCNLASPNFSRAWPTWCNNLIFLAQSRSYRRFPNAADDIFTVNVAAVNESVRYALRSRATRFIAASTGSVTTNDSSAARESDWINLRSSRSFYVATKLAAEVLLGAYASLLPVVQLRLFVPYGEGQNPQMLIPQLVQRVREGRPITLHGEDGLTTNPVSVLDVAEAIHRSLALEVSTTLNVAGPKVLTLREVGKRIGEVLHKKPRFELIPEKPPVLVGDVTEIRHVLGWSPGTQFHEGLRNWLTPQIRQNVA